MRAETVDPTLHGTTSAASGTLRNRSQVSGMDTRRALLVAASVSVMGLCSCPGEQATVSTPNPEKMNVYWGLLGAYPAEKHLNPYAVTRDDETVDSGALLYSIRREAKRPERIAAESGIPLEDVDRKLAELRVCALVAEKHGKYIVQFPFWDAPLRDEINRFGQQLADSIVDILDEELPALKTAVGNSSLPEQGYDWEDVSLTIVGGLLLDTGLNDRGLRKRRLFVKARDTPTRPGGYRYWYRAVEGGWGSFSKFGHNLTNLEGGWFGLFYGRVPGRKMDWSQVWDVHEAKERAVLRVLVRAGRIGQEELARAAGLQRSELRTLLDEMLEKQVVKIHGTSVEPGFPVLGQRDVRILLDRVDAICDRVIREVYDPQVPLILRRWEELAPENWEIEKVGKMFLRDVCDRPYNLVLDRLIRRGTLPPPPEKPPFMYWAINGHFEVL